MAVTSIVDNPVDSNPLPSQIDGRCKGFSERVDVCPLQQEENEGFSMRGEDTPNSVPASIHLQDISAKKELENEGKLLDRGGKEGCGNGRSLCGEIEVDIMECRESDDARLNYGDQATECSSSFESINSEDGSRSVVDRMWIGGEVESDLRDGNGAWASQEDDGVLGVSERSKKALNADWKIYRCGIEWRCRWLELRMKELQLQAERYHQILEEIRARKTWKLDGLGGASVARTVPFNQVPLKQRILHRKRRRKAEDTLDLDAYMARHPLFSRYDKKKMRDPEDAFTEGHADKQQNQQSTPNFLDVEDGDVEEQLAAAHGSVGDQDSMELVLWEIEALQARVAKTKQQLSRGAPPRKYLHLKSPKSSVLNLPRGPSQASQHGTSLALPSPRVSTNDPSTGIPTLARMGSGTGVVRRRSSDYDINNMVMPVSVGAKFVEQVRHVDIETPQWRLVENLALLEQTDVVSSSDEETDDTLYQRRHADMEGKEHRQRYITPLKRTSDGESLLLGTSSPKLGVGKDGAKMASGAGSETLARSSASEYLSPTFGELVPKGKRTKRDSRSSSFTVTNANRSVAQLAKPLESHTLSPEVVMSKTKSMGEVDTSMVENGGTPQALQGDEVEESLLQQPLTLQDQ